MPKIKVKDETVQTGECPQTNGRTDATKHIIIALATRSIKINRSAKTYSSVEMTLDEDGGVRIIPYQLV